MKTFRLLTAVGIAALMAAPSVASAQQKTLYVAGYGGSFEKTIRDEVIPTFEKENGVKVEYVAGNSTDTLAKLQAQKGNQQIDVAIVDDGPMYQAIQLGFCGKLDGLPADLYDTARFKDDRAVAIGIVATGLMYNTKVFAEKGWAPPTSWNDLKDTKYAKQLVIPPINNTYGLEALVMLSKMNGGGESNVDSGFKIFKEQINPNVLAYEPSPGKMTELFQSGQAVIAVWGTGRVQSFANTGFPVDFIYPKEGAATLLTTACPITKPNVSPLASSFIKKLLDPKIPARVAEGLRLRPGAEIAGGPAGARQDGADRRARGKALQSGLDGHQRQARGVDQALESRSRALIGHTGDSAMAYLELEGIAKQFGAQTVVDDFSLAVGKGEFISFLGPSGCGKTTTLQMIAGFLDPTRGAIRLEGKDLIAIHPAKRGLGIVFQSYALFPHMTAAENVALRPRDA
ncbi:spermidine/putrescine-binding protein [Bradyrhizobium sp. LB1.3]